jgi:hypothetical protein
LGIDEKPLIVLGILIFVLEQLERVLQGKEIDELGIVEQEKLISSLQIVS